MKSIKIIVSITVLLLISTSCSDDITSPPAEAECKLISYTDSLNYYYEVEYKDDAVFSLNYYKFEANEVQDLVRKIEIRRNVLNEIINIIYTNSEGNINFIDSVYRNQSGLPYEIVTFNSQGDFVEKTVRTYNNQAQVTQESNYKYKDCWEINSVNVYLYDNENRVIDRAYEQYLTNGTRKEHSMYKYDDMKNISKSVDIFTLFDKNNFTSVTTTYTSRDGNETVSTKTYMYEYNEDGYPTKVETASTGNESVTVRYNTIVCD